MSKEGGEEEEGWEDDEMEELFSFGAGETVDNNSSADANADGAPVLVDHSSAALSPQRDRSGSNDSFLEMLDDDSGLLDGTSSTAAVAHASGNAVGSNAAVEVNDKETQDILSWLDDEETPELVLEEPASEPSGSTSSSTPIPPPPPATPTMVILPELPPVPEPEPPKTLREALESEDSTTDQIRDLFLEENMQVPEELRPQLWSRMVCGKSVDALQNTTLAESFRQWNATATDDVASTTATATANMKSTVTWVQHEATLLADRIVSIENRDEAATALSRVLQFYLQGNQEDIVQDPLLPPVACTILAAGLTPPAAYCVLCQIMPPYMPLLALTPDERLSAATMLHTQFYLLAAYHLPLLVFHLDRYAPGWYWPKQLDQDMTTSSLAQNESQDKWRNLEQHGLIPQSWLISHLAGECNGNFMNPKWLLNLWDLILSSRNNSLRFFLSLAVLEKHADTLLMSTGDALMQELTRILEFKEGYTTLEGFAIDSEEDSPVSTQDAVDWVQEWCDRARGLWEATPRSVVKELREAEDAAVTRALMDRQELRQAELQKKLEAEAKAHADAMEAEQEKRAEEGRNRINRARLVAYYRKWNPDKEGNIDVIMKTYHGRLDALDHALKQKYGEGFHPTLKSTTAVPLNTRKLLSTMNQGLSNQRKRITQVLKKTGEDELVDPKKKKHPVTVRVACSEVLPIICWAKAKKNTSVAQSKTRPDALKFYLVDSRSEETAQEQGRFPTALQMSPEALLDPDRMKEQEDIFESLRGAAHIVVMGEGFSAVPKLYGQKMNPSLEQLIKEDESRTSLCALFFVKRGFPFVSILEGGFCEAHAWLSREEGQKYQLQPHSVLVDYQGDTSMFGELEKAHRESIEFANASAGIKTQMALQGLFDKSMTSITRSKLRLETMAESGGPELGNFTKFFKLDDTEEDAGGGAAAGKAEGARFRISFPTSIKPNVTAFSNPAPTTETPDRAAPPTTKDAQPPKAASSIAKPEESSETSGEGAKGDSSVKKFAVLGASRLSGLGSALNESMQKIGAVDKDNKEGGHNRFAGLASLTKSLNKMNAGEQQLPNVLKRNPFARFGGSAAGSAVAEQPKQFAFKMNAIRNPLARTKVAQEEAEIDFDPEDASLSLTEEPMQTVGLANAS